MYNDKLHDTDISSPSNARERSRWSCEYKGHVIDVDLARPEPDSWSINVAIRVVAWADGLRFLNRETARAAGERLGRAFVDELD
jgi:hypothetical protein